MANPATQGAGAVVAILHGSSWRTVGRDLRRRGFLWSPGVGRVSVRKRDFRGPKMIAKPTVSLVIFVCHFF